MAEIISIGNCQSEQLTRCLRLMLPAYVVSHIRSQEATGLEKIAERKGRPPIILAQHPIIPEIRPAIDQLRKTCTVIDYPSIAHVGFHPDLIRPKPNGQGFRGPMGTNHSAIILYGYLQGLSETAVRALFRAEVFNAIGYFNHKAISDSSLKESLRKFDLWDAAEFSHIQSLGCFMHATIHPKLAAIGMLARLILKRAAIKPKLDFPEDLMADDLANNIVWPVYPELGQRLGLRHAEYLFKAKNLQEHIFTLDEFITRCFECYRASELDQTCHARFADPTFLKIRQFFPDREKHVASNPYHGLPDHHFWRRSVAAVPADRLDPVTSVRVRIDSETKVATAGSCFAQHIARRLVATGHNYLVTEAGDGLTPEARLHGQYAIYSARYGNLYTARALVQLFRRAHGEYEPIDTTWQRADGRLIDPFRPEIEPDGFANADDLLQSREAHFAAVRTMFAQLELFVFTLGLTETWRSTRDGAVFPLCPAVVATDIDVADYEFVNFSHEETVADLKEFLSLLRSVNPAAMVLLTVSPVPLVATFERRHVMVSTVASKSILRSAADAIVRHDPNVDYFPSYEIVTNSFSNVCHFEADQRTVSSSGIDHVMRVFLAHYSSVPRASAPEVAPDSQIAAELADAQAVVCEEERLDS